MLATVCMKFENSVLMEVNQLQKNIRRPLILETTIDKYVEISKIEEWLLGTG